MKKCISMLLALVLAVSMLAGCGSKDNASKSDTGSDGKTIRVLTHMDGSFNAVKDAFEQATGIKLEIDVCSYEELNDQ